MMKMRTRLLAVTIALVVRPCCGQLLTLGTGMNPTVYSVLSVDPATGTYSAVATVAPSPLPVVLGSIAYDPFGQRFFFITNPAAGQFELYTVNIATQVTTHIPLASGSGLEPVYALAPTAIPSLSSLGRVGLLVLLALTGVVALRKLSP